MYGTTKARLALLVLVMAQQITAQDPQPPTSPGFTSRLLEDLPLEPERRLALKTAIGKRDYAAAEELLAEEARRQPQAQPILLVLANILFLDGKHLNCAVVMKKAEKLAPLGERSRFLLALSYVTIGRLNWAGPEFETLARLYPSNPAYPYWLSRIAYRKMDIESAAALARKAIQLDPMFMRAHDQLGLCYEALGSWHQAIQSFQQAVKLNSDLPERSLWPSMNLGVLLMRLERLEEAEAHLRESISIDRNFPVAHHRLGQVLEKEDRLDEAIAALQQAARLDPTYPEPHYALRQNFPPPWKPQSSRKRVEHVSGAQENRQRKGYRSARLRLSTGPLSMNKTTFHIGWLSNADCP